MPRPTSLRLAAILLPVIALLAPGAAHAEKVVTDDVAGDVQQAVAETPLSLTPAPDETAFDVVRTVAAYGRVRLSVTVRFRDLVQPAYTSVVARVRTPTSHYDVLVDRARNRHAKAALVDRRGLLVECRGLRVRFDGDVDELSLSVPSSCIETPRWLQIGVGTMGIAEAPLDGATPLAYFDDAHRAGTINENRLMLGPKVRRG